MYYPNLVMNHPELTLNLKFNLTWITDAEMRDLMKRHFAFEEMAYPDVDTQAFALQAKADLISDYWNHIYETTQYDYDPITNFDRYEDWEEDQKNNANSKVNSDTLSSQFPMDSDVKKAVNENEGTSNANTDATGNTKHRGHLYGNIGVTTSQQMIQSERDITLKLAEQYLRDFDDYFMLSM